MASNRCAVLMPETGSHGYYNNTNEPNYANTELEGDYEDVEESDYYYAATGMLALPPPPFEHMSTYSNVDADESPRYILPGNKTKSNTADSGPPKDAPTNDESPVHVATWLNRNRKPLIASVCVALLASAIVATLAGTAPAWSKTGSIFAEDGGTPIEGGAFSTQGATPIVAPAGSTQKDLVPGNPKPESGQGGGNVATGGAGVSRSTAPATTLAAKPVVLDVGFSAYGPSTIDDVTSWKWVVFSENRLSPNNAYKRSTFTAPYHAVYFLTFGAETEFDLSYRVAGASRAVGLSRQSDSPEYVSGYVILKAFSRSVLLEMQAGTSLSMEYRDSLKCCEGTSWSMASLSTAGGRPVAFTVTRESSWQRAGKVIYDTALVRTGNAYSLPDGAFIAPRDGIYYFSISTGIDEHQMAILQLQRNGRCVFQLSASVFRNGTDMISSAALVGLSRGDRVHVELVKGAIYSSPEYSEASFSGFLYEPAHEQRVAWSVWLDSSWPASFLKGARKVPFNVVKVNQGDAYQLDTHAVTVPVSGVYYLSVVAGMKANAYCSLSVMAGTSPAADGRLLGDLEYYSAGESGLDHTHREFVLPLVAGERVWLELHGRLGYSLYSDENLVTGFSGMLL